MKFLKNSLGKNIVQLTMVALSVLLLSAPTFANTISGSVLATGTQSLINDITTWLMVLAPVLAGVLIMYYCIRRSAADEMEQKQWTNRITAAVISCIGCIVGSVILNIIIGYYQ